MSKRVLLLGLAWVAAAVTYLVAAGADLDIGSRSECIGIVSLPRWFDESCRPALVPRIIIICIGLVPTLVLWYFAEKGQPRISAQGHKPGSTLRTHRVFIQQDGTYKCQDCAYASRSIPLSEKHGRKLIADAASLSDGPRVFASTAGAIPTNGVADAYKTCPDCAEQVRAAARKCRFCGYMFEERARAT